MEVANKAIKNNFVLFIFFDLVNNWLSKLGIFNEFVKVLTKNRSFQRDETYGHPTSLSKFYAKLTVGSDFL